MTTLCHSVRSWRFPSRSFHCSEVATRMLTTSPPLLSERASGSAPRLPTRITLFTPAISRSSESRCDRNPVGRSSCEIGQCEQISHHEKRPLPAVRLAPGDSDGGDALRCKYEPGEEGERRRERPAVPQLFDQGFVLRRIVAFIERVNR